MNLLVTAGNTQTPIDAVRCITNVFTGRTGTRIALEAYRRGHAVTLLTSQPNVVPELAPGIAFDAARFRVTAYRTYDDLHELMARTIATEKYDAVVHSAAVSDYEVTGVFAGPPGAMADASAGKVKSRHAELWLKLAPTKKLVDLIRAGWGFRGTLVKFKLEVGISEPELLAVAEQSRLDSQADYMVANTLEGMTQVAYLGGGKTGYAKVSREELAGSVLDTIEHKSLSQMKSDEN